MRASRSACLLLFLAACRDPGPSAARDAAVDTGPVDAAVVDALVVRAAQVSTDYATEACQCAADVAYCEATTAPPFGPDADACFHTLFASDPPRFDALLTCLASAVDAYQACAAPYACADVSPRQACKTQYQADGHACFDAAGMAAEAGYAGCLLANGTGADGG